MQAAGRKVSTVTSSPYAPYRSKLEHLFAHKLEMEKRAFLLESFSYEPLNLRLPGKKNFYKPDFLVVDDTSLQGLTFYEVKGHNRSDDRSLVKMKTAAGLNPWAKFVLVKHVKGEMGGKVHLMPLYMKPARSRSHAMTEQARRAAEAIGYECGYQRAKALYDASRITIIPYGGGIWWVEQNGKGEAVDTRTAKRQFRAAVVNLTQK